MAKKLKFKWWYLIILVVAAIIIYKLAGGDLFAAFSLPGEAVNFTEGFQLVTISSAWLPNIEKAFDEKVTFGSGLDLAVGEQMLEFNIVSAAYGPRRNLTDITIITNDGEGTTGGKFRYFFKDSSGSYIQKYERDIPTMIPGEGGNVGLWRSVQFYTESCTLNTANTSNICIQVPELKAYIVSEKAGMKLTAVYPEAGGRLFELDFNSGATTSGIVGSKRLDYAMPPRIEGWKPRTGGVKVIESPGLPASVQKALDEYNAQVKAAQEYEAYQAKQKKLTMYILIAAGVAGAGFIIYLLTKKR